MVKSYGADDTNENIRRMQIGFNSKNPYNREVIRIIIKSKTAKFINRLNKRKQTIFRYAFEKNA